MPCHNVVDLLQAFDFCWSASPFASNGALGHVPLNYQRFNFFLVTSRPLCHCLLHEIHNIFCATLELFSVSFVLPRTKLRRRLLLRICCVGIRFVADFSYRLLYSVSNNKSTTSRSKWSLCLGQHGGTVALIALSLSLCLYIAVYTMNPVLQSHLTVHSYSLGVHTHRGGWLLRWICLIKHTCMQYTYFTAITRRHAEYKDLSSNSATTRQIHTRLHLVHIQQQLDSLWVTFILNLAKNAHLATSECMHS